MGEVPFVRDCVRASEATCARMPRTEVTVTALASDNDSSMGEVPFVRNLCESVLGNSNVRRLR